VTSRGRFEAMTIDGEIKAHNLSNIIVILKFCGHHMGQQLIFQSLIHPCKIGFPSCCGLGAESKPFNLAL
jgi:hypothetical protein